VHIRADDLDTVACPTIDNMLKEQYAAVWQSLLVLSPRTCPSEGASMCIYKARCARPASLHPKTIFRLDLSNKSVQAFLRFRCAVII